VQTKFSVEIDLQEPPSNGKAQIVFRCTAKDRNIVTQAARILGVSVNRLMRSIVIAAANQILDDNDAGRKAVTSVKSLAKLMIRGDLPPGMKE
jgi:uncharacterized protein (DUF1778 family)